MILGRFHGRFFPFVSPILHIRMFSFLQNFTAYWYSLMFLILNENIYYFFRTCAGAKRKFIELVHPNLCKMITVKKSCQKKKVLALQIQIILINANDVFLSYLNKRPFDVELVEFHCITNCFNFTEDAIVGVLVDVHLWDGMGVKSTKLFTKIQ